MQKLALLLVLFFGLALSSCSDDAASPEIPKNNNGSDTNTFEIVSIDKDTVYWSEHVHVLLKHMPSSDITAYIHTSAVEVDSIWRDTVGNGGIRFRVPVGVNSGSLGVYVRDTLLAKNPPRIVVLAQDRSTMKPTVFAYKLEAYIGDLITLGGSDIPLRRSDIRVMLGDVELPVVGSTTSLIYARVMPGSVSGFLHVRMFDVTDSTHHLTILTASNELLPEKQIRSVTILTRGLTGTWSTTTKQGDSTIVEEFDEFPDHNQSVTFDNVTSLSTDDSLIFIANEINGAHRRTLEIRLKPDAHNSVSGIIRMEQVSGVLGVAGSVTVKNIRWTPELRWYNLIANSVDIPEQVPEFSWKITENDSVRVSTSNYTGSKVNSVFQITLAPLD